MVKPQVQLTAGLSEAKIEQNTKESREWLRRRARRLRRKYSLMYGSTSLTEQPMHDLSKRLPTARGDFIGQIFLFHYNPEGKDRLPYWDRFPLVLALTRLTGAFLGFNLHYISPLTREKMFEALLPNIHNPNEEWGPETHFRITWNTVKRFARYKYLRPTIKRYNTRSVTSRYMKIPPVEWEQIIFLPTERFEGATRQQVWRQSREKV